MQVKAIIDSVVRRTLGYRVLELLSKIEKWPYYYRPPMSKEDTMAARMAWHKKTKILLDQVRNEIEQASDPAADLALSGDIMGPDPVDLTHTLRWLNQAIRKLEEIHSDFLRQVTRLDFPSSVFDYFMSSIEVFASDVVHAYAGHPNESELSAFAQSHGLLIKNFTY